MRVRRLILAFVGSITAMLLVITGLYLLVRGDRQPTTLEVILGIVLIVVPILLLAAVVVGPPHRTRPYIAPDPMTYMPIAPTTTGSLANASPSPTLRLDAWGPGDEGLLEQLTGRSDVSDIQRRYEQLNGSGEGWMYKIVELATGSAVGCVGYWERTWHGDKIYETTLSVLPGSRGRGIETEASSRVVEVAKSEFGPRFLHAFTPVDDAWSNDLYRRLGFESAGSFEDDAAILYTDWRLDLFAGDRSDSVS